VTGETDLTLALIAALPFIGALLPGLMIRAGRDMCALSVAAATGTALILLLIQGPAVFRGEVIQAQIEWLPILGLNANFFLDGLGLMFGCMILGIGLLIILYARFYLYRSDPMGQFYTYLMLFQGAMLGIVLSDNILLLLVFWELTSLSSFLLIGYWRHLPEGRQGARMALAVTGMGGLALIGGMLLLGHIANSYELSVILTMTDEIQAHPLYLPALLLILLGCFTKSAQFPFHFWLPHAMAAPTPVSAYLHSATMVKAGIFLLARLWPVLAGTPEWFYLVATTGLITMVVAAIIALFKDDLKGLLAFSTVSHLGLITMLLGLGTPSAATIAVLHILNHVTFKAALFMTAGIVDHSVHTRDIKRLGGLATMMPITATIATVTALSMAGFPLLNGFISKEYMLEEAAETVWWNAPLLFPILAVLGATFSVAYSLRYIFHVFAGKPRRDYPDIPEDPGFGMWAAPALLAVIVVLSGVLPNLTFGPMMEVATSAVTGQDIERTLKLWHGLTPALFMSIFAIVVGATILWAYRSILAAWSALGVFHAKTAFDSFMNALVRGMTLISDWSHSGRLTSYLAIFSVATLVAALFAFGQGPHASGTRDLMPFSVVEVTGWLLLIVATLTAVILHRNRLLMLVLVGIIGLIVSLTFVSLSAPDLAMTQISVEVVTVILLLLALNFLPRECAEPDPIGRRWRDGLIAIGVGLSVAFLAWAIMTRDFETLSGYYLENSKPGGGGTNVVNVILVDFRGFDTFGEIIVLGIAALAIFALGESLLNGRASRRLANWVTTVPKAMDRHPLMMVVATRVILPLSLMVAVYIFLRGHNHPGGGFIAGLIAAIALLMQYMASGFAWAQERARLPYHSMIGLGVLAAGLTGVGAWFNGMPFLTSAFAYYEFPPIEEFELATAIAFDLGVFLTVVGSVMLALYTLSRMARRTGEPVNQDAMDYDPSREAPVGAKD